MNLKPCPACGSSSVRLNDASGWASCDNAECLLDGPHSDHTGAKWNALPRRTDASQGMSDGELIARAIRALRWEVGQMHQNDSITPDIQLAAELDRRAASREVAAVPSRPDDELCGNVQCSLGYRSHSTRECRT